MPIGRRPAEETLDDILAELTGIRQIFEANNSNNRRNRNQQKNPNSNSINNVRDAITGSLSPNAMKEKALTTTANAITSVANAYLALVQGALKVIKAEEKIKKATTIVSNVVTSLNGALKANKEFLKIKSLKGLNNLFDALGKLKTANVFAFWLYNKLITKKVMQNFVDGLTILAKSPELKKVDFRGIAMMFDSIGDNVIKLVGIVTTLAIITKIMGWDEILWSFVAIAGSIVILGGIFILANLMADKIKGGAEAIKEIGKAITALTVAVGLLIVLTFAIKFLAAEYGGWSLNDLATIGEFLVGGLVIGLMSGLAYAIVFKKGGKLFEETTQGIKNISIAIGLLILDLFGLMLLAKFQDEIPWEFLGKLLLSVITVVAPVALLNRFSKGDGKQAMYSIIGIGVLIGLFVIDLFLLTLIVKFFKKEEIDTAMNIMQIFLNSLSIILGILTVLSATIAISNVKLARLASGDTKNSILEAIARQKNPIFQTLVGISLLLLSISASMWIMVEIVKNNDTETIGLAIAIMAGFLIGTTIIITILNKIDAGKVKQGIIVLGAIELLCVGFSIIVLAFSKAAKSIKDLEWGDVGFYFGMLGLLLSATAALVALLGVIGIPVLVTAAFGVAALAAFELIIIESQVVLWSFAKFSKKFKKFGLKKEDVDDYFNVFDNLVEKVVGLSLILGGVGIVLHFILGPGLLMIAGITGVLLSIGAVMKSFADTMVKLKQNNVTLPTVDKDGNITNNGDVGVFFGIFNAMINSVTKLATTIKTEKIDFWTSWIIRSLGKSILPLIDACSKFSNMIIAFKNAKMPKAFDKDGNVVEWQTINPSDFSSAAEAIIKQFTDFISKLITNTKDLEWTQAVAIKKLGEGLMPIMNSISGFVDAILKLAVHQVYVGEEDYIDKDGNHQTRRKYVEVTDLMFIKSAVSLGILFELFLSQLLKETANLSGYQADVIKKLGEGLGPIMNTISSFIDAIMKFASGYIIAGEHTEEDKNGNKIIVKDWKHIDQNTLLNAGLYVGRVVSSFVKKLAYSIKQLDDADAWSPLKKSVDQINSLFTTLFGTIDKPGPVSSIILLAGALHNKKFPIGIKDGIMQFMDNPDGSGGINRAAWSIGVIMHSFTKSLAQWAHAYEDKWDELNETATQVNTLITTILGDGKTSSLKLIIDANEQIKKANIKSASDLIDKVFGKDFNEKIKSLSATPIETIEKVTSAYHNLMIQVTKLKQVTTSLNTESTSLFKTFIDFDEKLATTHDARIKRINEVKTSIQGVANSLNDVNKNLERKIALTNEQNRLSVIQPLQAMISFAHGNAEAFGNAVKKGQEQTQQFVERIFERNTTNNSNSNINNNTTNDNRNIAYGGGNAPTIMFNSKVVFMLPNGQQIEGFMMSEPT